MREVVVAYEIGALCAFSCSGAAENEEDGYFFGGEGWDGFFGGGKFGDWWCHVCGGLCC